jgi:hypothetical protein
MFLKQCLDHFLLNIRLEELFLRFIVLNFFGQKVNLMYLDCSLRSSDVNQRLDSSSKYGSESRDANSTDPVSVYKTSSIQLLFVSALHPLNIQTCPLPLRVLKRENQTPQWSVLTAPSQPHWHAVDAKLLQFSTEILASFIIATRFVKKQIGRDTSRLVFVLKIVLLSIASWERPKSCSTFIGS